MEHLCVCVCVCVCVCLCVYAVVNNVMLCYSYTYDMSFTT